MPFDPQAPLPFLTHDLAGIGGRIKVQPEDFQVEEIPAYQPCGTGEFLFLWVEKRGMGAEFMVRQIARQLDLRPGDIGTAGLKDRHALTRQWVSIPSVEPEKLSRLESEELRILQVSRHGNKLRPGHLHGNRFHILIRDPRPDAVQTVEPIVDRLRQLGMPNFYGEQRFGREGETLQLGLALLRGETDPRTSRRIDVRNRFLRKLALSAAQSALFNHYLRLRMADGLLHQVLPGDVMAKRPAGGLFVAQDLPTEQARFDRREIVPAGPMYGRKMFAAAELAAAREAAALAEAGLAVQSFSGFGKLLEGTRRPNLVFFQDLTAVSAPAGVELQFSLPAGSYATILLREIMKNNFDDSEVVDTVPR